jgi:hypothetical protein
MSLALNLVDQWSDGKRLHVIADITITGNYVTGGDALNWGGAGVRSAQPPEYVDVKITTGYTLQFKPVTSSTDGLLQAFVIGTGVELAAGAYPAGVLNAVVRAYAIFLQFE